MTLKKLNRSKTKPLFKSFILTCRACLLAWVNSCRQEHAYKLANYSARGAIGAVNRDIARCNHTHIHWPSCEARCNHAHIDLDHDLDPKCDLDPKVDLDPKFDLHPKFDLDPEFQLDSEFPHVNSCPCRPPVPEDSRILCVRHLSSILHGQWLPRDDYNQDGKPPCVNRWFGKGKQRVIICNGR